MVKRHLKRMNAPSTWPIARKERKWIVRPQGGHKKVHSLPLAVVLREIIKVARTGKESRTILNQKLVLINGKPRKDPKYGVGLMDVLEIPSMKINFRLLLNKHGKLFLHSIDDKETAIIPRKITGKKAIKGGKIQLSFSDGFSMLSDAKDSKVGDTIVFENNKPKEHLKFEKGALVYIVSGKQAAMHGTVEEVRSFAGAQPDNILVHIAGKSYETRKEYVMVIGKDKPVISLGE